MSNASNLNAFSFNAGWIAYSPVLQGSTNDPSAVTYTTQIGRYKQVGNMVFFKITIATSSITKSTLTDVLRISLPIPAANNAGEITQCSAIIENSTPVVNGNAGEITANTSYLQFRNLPLTAGSSLVTYALLTGLGVLTNAIVFRASGFYEV